MRTREQITKDGLRPEFLILEVLLDIRDLLSKKETKKRGRPRKRSVSK